MQDNMIEAGYLLILCCTCRWLIIYSEYSSKLEGRYRFCHRHLREWKISNLKWDLCLKGLMNLAIYGQHAKIHRARSVPEISYSFNPKVNWTVTKMCRSSVKWGGPESPKYFVAAHCITEKSKYILLWNISYISLSPSTKALSLPQRKKHISFLTNV